MQSTACCGLESSRVTKSGHSTPTGQQCWQQPLRFTTEKRPVQRSPAHGSASPAGSDVYESTGSPDVRTAAKRGSGVSADRQGRAGLRLCPTDGCELAHGKQPFPLSTHRTPRPRQGRFRHPSTHLSRQPAGQESKRARPPPPHGCLGTALGSASQRAWQRTGPAGPAASPRGSTLCVAATSEGFKVARPQLRDSEGLQVWASDGKDSPGGSGQTWALTPGQSEEVTEIVSGECVQWGCWRGSVG